LCFEWVSRVRIDLDYGEYVGQGLLFSAEATELEDQWRKLYTLPFVGPARRRNLGRVA
jgi:hypothetical protein